MKWSRLPLIGLALGLMLLAAVACSSAQGSSNLPQSTSTPSSSNPAAAPSGANPDATGASLSNPAAGLSGPATGLIAADSSRAAAVSPAPASGYSQSTGIWVTGTGEVSVKPDLALVYLGVQADGTTVAEARDKAATAMQSVTDALKALGIADNDIQTQYFSIQPKYTYQQVNRCPDTSGTSTVPVPATVAPAARDAAGGASGSVSSGVATAPTASTPLPPNCYTESQQVLVGYAVTNQVTVKVHNLDNVSKVVDNAAQAGGDVIRVNNVSFTVENDSAARSQAREAAVKEAMAKAQQFAQLTGVTLGKLQYISESYASTPIPYAIRSDASMGVAAPASVPTPISTGELDISATVHAGFAILD